VLAVKQGVASIFWVSLLVYVCICVHVQEVGGKQLRHLSTGSWYVLALYGTDVGTDAGVWLGERELHAVAFNSHSVYDVYQ
jgi:hypothetical protein